MSGPTASRKAENLPFPSRWWKKAKMLWRVRRHHRPDHFALGWTLFAFAFALSVPLWAKGFQLFQFSNVCVYALALLGLNLLSGYNGQLSLGHGAFFGIGAFGAGIFMNRYGMPYVPALFASGLVCFVFGLLFGIPALRLERISLALATFALAVAMPQIFFHFDDLTGGSAGLTIKRPAPPAVLSALFKTTDAWIYALCIAFLVITIYLCANLMDSRHGRAIRSIRDQDIASEAMGVNNNLYKIICFGLSSAITGIAGGLSALLIGNVAPETFHAGLSVTFLTGIVVGGMGSTFGPVFGAAFIHFLPNYTENISKALTSAIYGVILILFIYADPSGLSGVLKTLRVRGRDVLSYFKL